MQANIGSTFRAYDLCPVTIVIALTPVQKFQALEEQAPGTTSNAPDVILPMMIFGSEFPGRENETRLLMCILAAPRPDSTLSKVGFFRPGSRSV